MRYQKKFRWCTSCTCSGSGANFILDSL